MNPGNPVRAGAAQSALRALSALTALILLVACAPSSPHPGTEGAVRGADRTVHEPIERRIVYLIHGDADYLFHDADGHSLQADEEMFKQAVAVAVSAPRSEVFIFHQRPVTTRMFRRAPGGTFLHYRYGVLLTRRNYSLGAGTGAFSAEAALYQSNVDDFEQPRRVFAYFGHEIPLQAYTRYSASHPDQDFSVARFADGLSQWTLPSDGATKPFDLVVLSTCNGGNPPLLNALLSRADFVVASPADLHLSYLDTRALADSTPVEASAGADTAIRALANRIATRSFESLSEKTATEITVAVYDLEKARPFLTGLTAAVPRSPTDSGSTDSARIPPRPPTPPTAKIRWRDCEQTTAFNPELAGVGVRLWFRAPRFGPRRDVTARSAWECAL